MTCKEFARLTPAERAAYWKACQEAFKKRLGSRKA